MTASVLNEADVKEGVDAKGISDYERYNVAAWLKQIAPESDLAQQHFAALQANIKTFASVIISTSITTSAPPGVERKVR